MRLESAARRPSLLAAVLAQIESWLLEPAAPRPLVVERVELPVRPVVAVVGLAPRCGATTFARALAARLAALDPARAAIVAGSDQLPVFAPAGRSAARLAERMSAPGASVSAAGRLCLIPDCDLATLVSSARALAPLVIDVPRHRAPSGATSLAHLTILVAPGDGEPALADLASRSLARPGREPLTVANRVDDPARWGGRASFLLPESRSGARLAAAGWEARGAFGSVVSGLASLCGEAVCA